MSYERLVQFAKKVARELLDARVEFTPTESPVRGWKFDTMLMEEITVSGRDTNTELFIETDELWLASDGSLKLARETLNSVIGRIAGVNRSTTYAVEDLTESYALRRDGRPLWRTHVERRGPGVRADHGTRSFVPPSQDRPQCLTVSSALGRIRPAK